MHVFWVHVQNRAQIPDSLRPRLLRLAAPRGRPDSGSELVEGGGEVRVVLYANDMEPITVLELPLFVVEHLNRHQRVVLPVTEPAATAHANSPVIQSPRSAAIVSERFVRHGQEHMLLFTADEESAMLLQSVFLPGQRRALQEAEKSAFASGFLEALYRSVRGAGE